MSAFSCFFKILIYLKIKNKIPIFAITKFFTIVFLKKRELQNFLLPDYCKVYLTKRENQLHTITILSMHVNILSQ
jgi:hypothetical protein